MATIEVSGTELLKAVQQLGPEELDAFLEKALLLRNQPRADKLSASAAVPQRSRIRVSRWSISSLAAAKATNGWETWHFRARDATRNQYSAGGTPAPQCKVELSTVAGIALRMSMRGIPCGGRIIIVCLCQRMKAAGRAQANHRQQQGRQRTSNPFHGGVLSRRARCRPYAGCSGRRRRRSGCRRWRWRLLNRLRRTRTRWGGRSSWTSWCRGIGRRLAGIRSRHHREIGPIGGRWEVVAVITVKGGPVGKSAPHHASAQDHSHHGITEPRHTEILSVSVPTRPAKAVDRLTTDCPCPAESGAQLDEPIAANPFRAAPAPSMFRR